jgi:hypothetical protein
MNTDDADEATVLLGDVISRLYLVVTTNAGQVGYDFRRLAGDLAAGAEASIRGGTVGTDLAACFASARAVGIGRGALMRVLSWAEDYVPFGLPATAVQLLAIRLCLVELCLISAGTTYVSRDDVNLAIDDINSHFYPAEEEAADELDASVYSALIALHGAAVRDLAERARPLPQIVSYRFGIGTTALALANRIHADASRVQELVSENKIVNPAFCPPVGRALSA